MADLLDRYTNRVLSRVYDAWARQSAYGRPRKERFDKALIRSELQDLLALAREEWERHLPPTP